MPFTLLILVIAIALSYARGGRLERMAEAQLGRGWLLGVGLGLQIAVDILAAREVGGPILGYMGLLASQALILVWAAPHWYRPGVALVVVGMLLNAIVMAANGAMPVDLDALASAGLSVLPAGKHEVLTTATRFGFLADVIPVRPIRSVISVGDIVLAAGALPLVHHLMTFRAPVITRWWGARVRARLDV